MSEASFQSEIFVAHKNVSFIVKAGNACVLATSTLETKEKKKNQQPGSKTEEELSSLKWSINFSEGFIKVLTQRS